MKQQLIPLGDRVLVRRAESKNSIGAILLPEAAKETPQEGTVIALGEGDHGFIVDVGDTVLLPKYGALEITLNEEKLSLIKEEDILGILKTAEDDSPDEELLEANIPPGAMPQTVADDDMDEPLGTPQTCTDEVCESCQ